MVSKSYLVLKMLQLCNIAHKSERWLPVSTKNVAFHMWKLMVFEQRLHQR